jgi:hypothetical protein
MVHVGLNALQTTPAYTNWESMKVVYLMCTRLNILFKAREDELHTILTHLTTVIGPTIWNAVVCNNSMSNMVKIFDGAYRHTYDMYSRTVAHRKSHDEFAYWFNHCTSARQWFREIDRVTRRNTSHVDAAWVSLCGSMDMDISKMGMVRHYNLEQPCDRGPKYTDYNIWACYPLSIIHVFDSLCVVEKNQWETMLRVLNKTVIILKRKTRGDELQMLRYIFNSVGHIQEKATGEEFTDAIFAHNLREMHDVVTERFTNTRHRQYMIGEILSKLRSVHEILKTIRLWNLEHSMGLSTNPARFTLFNRVRDLTMGIYETSQTYDNCILTS